jgi:hypothetical protein
MPDNFLRRQVLKGSKLPAKGTIRSPGFFHD